MRVYWVICFNCRVSFKDHQFSFCFCCSYEARLHLTLKWRSSGVEILNYLATNGVDQSSIIRRIFSHWPLLWEVQRETSLQPITHFSLSHTWLLCSVSQLYLGLELFIEHEHRFERFQTCSQTFWKAFDKLVNCSSVLSTEFKGQLFISVEQTSVYKMEESC